MHATFDNITLDYRHLRATKPAFIHLPKHGLDFVGSGLLLPHTDEQFGPSSTNCALYLYLCWYASFPRA